MKEIIETDAFLENGRTKGMVFRYVLASFITCMTVIWS